MKMWGSQGETYLATGTALLGLQTLAFALLFVFGHLEANFFSSAFCPAA